MKKSVLQHLWDLLGSPLRMVLLPDDWSTRLGLTSLEDERIGHVLPHLCGELLDVGAGRNRLVERYGRGVGADIHDWGGGTVQINDSADLPFPDDRFDTVSFVACLNHIPNRAAALGEAFRVLRPGGRVVLTMIDPILGGVGHKIWWYSEDKQREIAEGELDGMWSRDVTRLCEAAGFTLAEHRRFLYGLNHLFVGIKARILKTASVAFGPQLEELLSDLVDLRG